MNATHIIVMWEIIIVLLFFYIIYLTSTQKTALRKLEKDVYKTVRKSAEDLDTVIEKHYSNLIESGVDKIANFEKEVEQPLNKIKKQLNEINKMQEKLNIQQNIILKLSKQIEIKDAIIERKTKQIARLKERNGRRKY